MLRDSCQDVSCCRLFCFYHMRCVFSRCVESQHCLQERRTFLSICCSMCTPKNKTLTFQGAALYFLQGTGTACKCSKFAVRYSGDLQPHCCWLLFWSTFLFFTCPLLSEFTEDHESPRIQAAKFLFSNINKTIRFTLVVAFVLRKAVVIIQQQIQQYIV